MPRVDVRAVDVLRHASRCPRSCTIDIRADESFAVVGIMHNGVRVDVPVGDLSDVGYDVWSDVCARWASLAADLHRNEAMQSDWPVF